MALTKTDRKSERRPQIILFGRPRVISKLGAEIDLPKNSYIVILKILRDGRDNSFNRDEISSFIWPRKAINVQRANFRTLIKRINSAQNASKTQIFDFERKNVNLLIRENCIDYCRFVKNLEKNSFTALPELDALMAKGFLDGFDSSDNELSEWIRIQKLEIIDKFLSLADRALESRFFRLDQEFEFKLASKCIEFNPLDEMAYRALFRVYHERADQNSLEQSFRKLKAAFLRELNGSPSTETVRLFESFTSSGGSREAAGRDVSAPSLRRSVSSAPTVAIHHELPRFFDPDLPIEAFAAQLVTQLWKMRSVRIAVAGHVRSSATILAGPPEQTYDLFIHPAPDGDRRLSLTLSHRRSASVIWADQMRVALGAVDGAVRSIAATVATKLEEHQIALSSDVEPDRPSPFALVAAADRLLVDVDLRSIRRARRLYRQATDEDARNLRALSGLSRTFWLEWLLRAGADQYLLATAQQVGRQALVAAPDSHLSHRELGMVALYARRFDLALEHLSRARILMPNDPSLTFDFADALVGNGQAREGMELALAVQQSDPGLETFRHWVTASGLFIVGEYQAAIDRLAQMSNEEAGYRLRAACLAMQGNREEAEAFRLKALAANPTFSLESWLKVVPIRNAVDAQHVLEGFVEAGFR